MNKKKTVFYVSLGISLFLIGLGVIMPKQLERFSNNFLEFIYDYLGWLLLSSVFFFFVFCLFLSFSRFGRIRLGDDNDRPHYPTITWIAMLFSASIGISLVFWGVAEPVSYYIDPPFGEAYTAESAKTAMQFVYLHWGVSAWSCYALVGVCLAYFQFRQKLPSALSSAFYPVLGEGIRGPIGKTIDIITILSIVIGVATSLGFGTLQVNTGMQVLWDIPNNFTIQLTIILSLTFVYLWSATTGLNRGIKYLSNINMLLSLALIGFILFLGPTQTIFKIFFQGIADYTNNFLGMSFRTEPYSKGTWIASWTLFYFGWWIAWAPLVGSFVARISKGRTIREFMMGALFIPVIASFFWFAVLGGSALYFIHNLGHITIAQAVKEDVTVALFTFFNYFPLSFIISIVAMVLILIYFVTSADSAIFVLGMVSENGNQYPSKKIKIIWGVIIAAVLLVTGGLKGLQSALVATAIPLSILLLFLCYSMYKGLSADVDSSSVTISTEKASKK